MPVNRRFVGYEKALTCFRDELPLSMEVYPKQVSSLASDIAGGRKAVKSSRAYVKEIPVMP